jgi:hypothetical protein
MFRFSSSSSGMALKGFGLLFVLCVAGQVYGSRYPKEFTTEETVSTPSIVQLWRATLPQPLRLIAVHYWFVAYIPERRTWQRWEVWQDEGFGANSWGHVRRDLQALDGDVGGGPASAEMEWQGDTARKIYSVLNAPQNYPYRKTYAAWVLKQSEVPYDFDPRAIGKDYAGMLGASLTSARSGFQVDSPVSGFKAGFTDGVEAHFFCLTFGLDLWPPALKTPFGRFGFPSVS